jgi:hypothetical protein
LMKPGAFERCGSTAFSFVQPHLDGARVPAAVLDA